MQHGWNWSWTHFNSGKCSQVIQKILKEQNTFGTDEEFDYELHKRLKYASVSDGVEALRGLNRPQSSAADYSVDMDTSLTFTAQKDERRMVTTQNTVNTTVSLRLTCVGVRSFHWRCPEVSPQHHPRGWGSNCRTAVATLPEYLETDDSHMNEGCATHRYNTGNIIQHVQLRHMHLHLWAPTMSKPEQWVSYWLLFNNRGRPAQTEAHSVLLHEEHKAVTQQGYKPVRLYKLWLTCC